jgi:hypothetical protein
MSLDHRTFVPAVCIKCTSKNNDQPPCIRLHRIQSHGMTVFRAIDSPGGLCGYYARWPELADRVMHGNYVAYDHITTRYLRDSLKVLLNDFHKQHPREDIRSSKAADACHYSRVGTEVGYVIDKTKALNQATIVSIVSVPPQDPMFPHVLRYFAQYVTKAVTPGTQWKFCTCSGKSGGAGPGTAATADVVLIDPTGNKWRYRLSGAGIGKLSPTPVGGTYSQEDWWSKGFVYNLSASELDKDDFVGPCSFGDAALVLVFGFSGTVIWTKNALIFMMGQAMGTPGIDKCAGSMTLVGASNDTSC